MKELLYNLIGLKQYIKQYHWLAKGYDNHILADKLEDDLDEQIDELAELLLAIDENTNVSADYLLREATTRIPQTGLHPEMHVILQNIANMCGVILGICKDNHSGNELAELAFSDYVGRLSNSIVRKLYLIQLQFGK